MAWGYRTGSYANDGAGSQNSSGVGQAIVSGAAVSAGDLLLIACGSLVVTGGGSVTSFSISDNINGAWGSVEVATGTFVVVGLNAKFSLFAFPNSGAGTPTVTVTTTFTGGGLANLGMQYAAFSGIVTSAPLDTKAVTAGTGANGSSGAVSPATFAANELMVGAYWDAGEGIALSVGNIAGSAASLAGKHDSDGGKWEGLLEYGDSGSGGGTPAATITNSANNGYGVIGAVFKIIGGAPAAPIGKLIKPIQAINRAATY